MRQRGRKRAHELTCCYGWLWWFLATSNTCAADEKDHQYNLLGFRSLSLSLSLHFSHCISVHLVANEGTLPLTMSMDIGQVKAKAAGAAVAPLLCANTHNVSKAVPATTTKQTHSQAEQRRQRAARAFPLSAFLSFSPSHCRRTSSRRYFAAATLLAAAAAAACGTEESGTSCGR